MQALHPTAVQDCPEVGGRWARLSNNILETINSWVFNVLLLYILLNVLIQH